MTMQHEILAYIIANNNCNLRQLIAWIVSTNRDRPTAIGAIQALNDNGKISVSFDAVTGESFVSTTEGV
jgi:hypothetical protein